MNKLYKFTVSVLVVLFISSIVITAIAIFQEPSVANADQEPPGPGCEDRQIRNLFLDVCGTCSNPPYGRYTSGQIRICNKCTGSCGPWTDFTSCSPC